MVLRNSGRVGSRRFSEEASVSDKDTEALFVLYLYIYLDAGMDCSCVLGHEFSADL